MGEHYEIRRVPCPARCVVGGRESCLSHDVVFSAQGNGSDDMDPVRTRLAHQMGSARRPLPRDSLPSWESLPGPLGTKDTMAEPWHIPSAGAMDENPSVRIVTRGEKREDKSKRQRG